MYFLLWVCGSDPVGFFYPVCMYLFLCVCVSSTTGEEVINRMALEYRQEGRDREEIRASDLQDAIAEAVSKTNSSEYRM